MKKQEFHLDIVTDTDKASKLLAEKAGMSQQLLKKYMNLGAVWLERGGSVRRLRRASTKVQPDDKLHFYCDESLLQEDVKEAVLIEDCGGYSFWFKPSGMLSQGSKWGDANTIYRFAETNLKPERPAFIVHRLDRAASGLILLAHSKKTARQLSQIFEEKALVKEYQAVVQGNCTCWLSEKLLDEPIEGKAAKSYVCCMRVAEDKKRSLLNIRIETGRKHQIRKHLSGSSHEIVGDRLYGGALADEIDLQLRAYHLEFLCPMTNERKNIVLPEALQLSL